MTDHPPERHRPRPRPATVAALTTIFVALVGVGIGLTAVRGCSDETRRTKTLGLEGRLGAKRLARGVLRCASRLGSLERPDGSSAGRCLPETASPVPASEEAVRGKRYRSVPGDWSETAYVCADFSLEEPQAFRYRWEKLSPAHGRVSAAADADGDGRADTTFTIEIQCRDERKRPWSGTGRCVCSGSNLKER